MVVSGQFSETRATSTREAAAARQGVRRRQLGRGRRTFEYREMPHWWTGLGPITLSGGSVFSVYPVAFTLTESPILPFCFLPGMYLQHSFQWPVCAPWGRIASGYSNKTLGWCQWETFLGNWGDRVGNKRGWTMLDTVTLAISGLETSPVVWPAH